MFCCVKSWGIASSASHGSEPSISLWQKFYRRKQEKYTFQIIRLIIHLTEVYIVYAPCMRFVVHVYEIFSQWMNYWIFTDSRSSTPRYSGGRPPSPGRGSTDVALRNIIQEKTKIEGEVLHLKSDIKNLENDNSLLQAKVNFLDKVSFLKKIIICQSWLQSIDDIKSWENRII